MYLNRHCGANLLRSSGWTKRTFVDQEFLDLVLFGLSLIMIVLYFCQLICIDYISIAMGPQERRTGRTLRESGIFTTMASQDSRWRKEDYSWIADQRHAHKKIILSRNQKGYDNFETTVGKFSARRIRIFRVYFCLGSILKVILINFQNNA